MYTFRSFWLPIIIVAISVLGLYAYLYTRLDQSLLSHNVYDSFTLQALQWWKGKIALDQDYPYLELAFYKDQVWVSFPPLQSVVEFFLVPLFGRQTPNTLLSTLYTLGSIAAITAMVFRTTRKIVPSLFWGVTVPLASNLVTLSVSGSVWFVAQSFAFFLSSLAVLCMTGNNRRFWHLGLLFWALSIACRPFQILYAPVMAWLLVDHIKRVYAPRTLTSWVRICAPFVILPLIVGILIGTYNFVRFDKPWEYGHTYLPEHMRAPLGQFNPGYMGQNIQNILRLPTIEDGKIAFPKFGGFAFYLANPLYLVLLTRVLWGIVRKRIVLGELIIMGCLAVHATITLMHLSFGAWQFGTRFLVDFLPYVFLLIMRIDKRVWVSDIVLLTAGVILNVYGALWLYLSWGP